MGRDFSSFDGISRASPLGVTAQATVSLRQSRYKNAVWVGDRLANTIDLYNNDTGRGVFGQTFNGYEKTRYKKRCWCWCRGFRFFCCFRWRRSSCSHFCC